MGTRRICRGMSWDVLLMRLPPGVHHLAKLPPAYAPPSLGARTDVAVRLGALSGFELLDPAFGVLRDEDFVIEIGLGHALQVDHLVLHVSGSPLVLDVVRDIAGIFEAQAIDCEDDTVLDFDEPSSRRGLERWQARVERSVDAELQKQKAIALGVVFPIKGSRQH